MVQVEKWIKNILDSLHFCRFLWLRRQIQLLLRKNTFSFLIWQPWELFSSSFVLIWNLRFYMIHCADFHQCSKNRHFFSWIQTLLASLQVWLTIMIVFALDAAGASWRLWKGRLSLYGWATTIIHSTYYNDKNNLDQISMPTSCSKTMCKHARVKKKWTKPHRFQIPHALWDLQFRLWFGCSAA